MIEGSADDSNSDLHLEINLKQPIYYFLKKSALENITEINEKRASLISQINEKLQLDELP